MTYCVIWSGFYEINTYLYLFYFSSHQYQIVRQKKGKAEVPGNACIYKSEIETTDVSILKTYLLFFFSEMCH